MVETSREEQIDPAEQLLLRTIAVVEASPFTLIFVGS